MKLSEILPRKSLLNCSSKRSCFPVDCRNAPGHAKADLKKLLQTNHVRKTTSQYILSNLGLVDTDLSASIRSDEGFHEDPHLAPPTTARPEQRQRVASATGSFTASVAGSVATSAILSAAGAEMEQMDACIIASKGDLEYEIQGMLPAFEGRESEQNWNLRDKYITRLRGLLRGNAYKEYPTTFMNGIGNLQSGIIKGVLLSQGSADIDDIVTNAIMFEIL
jgi:CLIP-associating protein 1/2